MPKKRKSPTTPRRVSTLKHEAASRTNIPTAEYEAVLDPVDQNPVQVAFERRNRDLDPQLVWRGKEVPGPAELTAQAPPLFIQEKVHPKVLADDLARETRRRRAEAGDEDGQPDLFADFNGLPSDEARAEFYQHDANWSNRMILGDSLQVMASLAEREGLRGKVQCIYMDPPYGIKFNSNFQWSTTSRDVKDGKAEHISREPEQVKAFRDTWRDGIHSYLTYLRDRLTVARELLAESGSIFVQIGDENVHRVRALMDEVFGVENFVSMIQFQKTGSQAANFIANTVDFILWFAKSAENAKYRQIYDTRVAGQVSLDRYDQIEFPDSTERRLSKEELRREVDLPDGRVFRHTSLISSGEASEKQPFVFQKKTYRPSAGSHWKTTTAGLSSLSKAGRIASGTKTIRYKRFLNDFSVLPITDRWESLQIGTGLLYVVQTSASVVERCILMSTDPGDLVIDPTCGSGTTAYAAEKWGRRWITIDTSRVALALARARIMGARYAWYLLADSAEGQRKEAELARAALAEAPTHGDVRQGFVYERVPHITLKSIANNAEIDTIWERWQETLEPLREDLNAHLDRGWEEWQIPREPGDPWPEAATRAWNKLVNALQNGSAAPDDRSPAPVGDAAGAKQRSGSNRATADGGDPLPVAVARGANHGDDQLRAVVEGRAKRGDGAANPVAGGARHRAARARAAAGGGPKRRGQPDPETALATLNEALDRHHTLEDLPDRPYDPWKPEATESHRLWWEARVARQQEIDAAIAARADVEYLYDKPYDDPKRVRVAGPFTVESLSPHRLLAFDEADQLIDRVAERAPAYGTAEDFAAMALGHLATSGVQQAHKADRITFSSIEPWPGERICAVGGYTEGDDGPERRAGIVIGPEFGTVSRQDLVRAAREAAEAGFDVLIACAFNFEAHVTEFNKLGALPVLKARMNADLHMADDLANTGKGNLFVIFGEPDIEIGPAAEGDPQTGRIQVQIHGVDVFHPSTGEVRSDGPDGIACWFIDTDYNDESFFVRQAYFLGANDPYKALRTTLKAEIDADAWATLHSDTSRPFARPKSGRIAVKVINHLGDEVMKVFQP